MSTTITGSYENYLQSTINGIGRLLTSPEICVFSIPQDLYGTHIQPTSLQITFFSQSTQVNIVDDGEGRLFITNSIAYTDLTGSFVGDVIYPHGIAVITNNTLASDLNNIQAVELIWKSNVDILTGNYNCKVRDYEFNFTQNPTALVSGTLGLYNDNLTGSAFQPYITSVGLYNDVNELLAVAKISKPIPKTPHTDMTFVIRLDI